MGSLDEATTLLRSVPLFEGLDQEDLARLAGSTSEQEIGEGETLFQEGEEGDRFFVVVDGAVEITRRGGGGGEEKLAVRRNGQAFGEMALLDDSPRSATARAVERSRLLVLERDVFRTFLDPDSAAFRMLVSMSKALRALDVRFTAKEARGFSADGVHEFNRVLQRGLLPRNVAGIEGYEFAATSPYGDGTSGRTVWDLIPGRPGEAHLVVMEAEAGVLPPAHTLAVVRALFRALAERSDGVDALLGGVSDALAESTVEGSDAFARCGVLRVGRESAEWGSGGKTPAGLVRADGTVEILTSFGPPLGMLKGFHYGRRVVELEAGDSVLILSSGSEGLLRGAGDLIRSLGKEPVQEVVATLRGAVDRAKSGTDTTVAFLRKK
jgi:phosphoserine phosphatase RsbU/P